jgi:hypothetical protein
MNARPYIVTLAVIAASIAPAWAQGPGLAGFDSNQDGIVTRAEFDAGQRTRFAELDTNGDGALRSEEAPMRWGPGGDGPPPPPPQDARPPSFDSNRDGAITGDEFAAAGAQMFARLDANGDGRIGQDERPRPPPH